MPKVDLVHLKIALLLQSAHQNSDLTTVEALTVVLVLLLSNEHND